VAWDQAPAHHAEERQRGIRAYASQNQIKPGARITAHLVRSRCRPRISGGAGVQRRPAMTGGADDGPRAAARVPLPPGGEPCKEVAVSGGARPHRHRGTRSGSRSAASRSRPPRASSSKCALPRLILLLTGLTAQEVAKWLGSAEGARCGLDVRLSGDARRRPGTALLAGGRGQLERVAAEAPRADAGGRLGAEGGLGLAGSSPELPGGGAGVSRWASAPM